MPTQVGRKPRLYSTAEVAKMAGVHRDTLHRWLREGRVREPQRDSRGWRVFTREEAETIATHIYDGVSVRGDDSAELATFLPGVSRLMTLDWDFAGAKTDYLTHGLHPYPAKFIPQIPNALIQELSSVEETVADIFCGSGTTLVEALTLKRHAVGVDASPIACLISQAKTTRLAPGDQELLRSLVEKASVHAESLAGTGSGLLFEGQPFVSSAPRPTDEGIAFWFEPGVTEELAEILSWCKSVVTETGRVVALAAFSAIVVAVSRQDSDTRYVRREKDLEPGDTFRRFARALENAIRGVVEFTELAEQRFVSRVLNVSVLDQPQTGPVDLMVCSPPYPNAWSYHLYHRTRMLWLGMDQPKFKLQEIGSHRKFSRKAPTEGKVAMFRDEVRVILGWLRHQLRRGRFAVFVIGDSIIDGRVVSNADILADAGQEFGFRETGRIDRTIQATKKAFNPRIGKIKEEQILILQNQGGGAQ